MLRRGKRIDLNTGRKKADVFAAGRRGKGQGGISDMGWVGGGEAGDSNKCGAK